MLESILSSLFSAGMLLSSFAVPTDGATDYSRYTNKGSKPISLARENSTDAMNPTEVINATDVINVTESLNAVDVINATGVFNSTTVLPLDEPLTVTCATSTSLWQTCAQFASENALALGVGVVVLTAVTTWVYLKIRGPQWPVGTPGLANSKALPPDVLARLIKKAALLVKLTVHSDNNLPGYMPGWAQTSPSKKAAFIDALRQLVANYLENVQN